MFNGTYTALVTPFRNGQVDVKAFEALVDRQAAAGIEELFLSERQVNLPL